MIVRRLSDERGSALVTAIVLTMLMLSIGLSVVALGDSNTDRVREQRERESSLNLDEGVLFAQGFVLANHWPSAEQPYPSNCTSAGAATVAAAERCPNPATLASAQGGTNFANVDQSGDTSWITKVRDNGPPLDDYVPENADLPQVGEDGTVCPGPCTYDFNGDKELWVQAQSTVRGRPRNVVARLKLEEVRENVPNAGVTAGALSVTNRGNHGGTPIIDATGSDVLVRCPAGGACLQSEPGQIVPTPKIAAAPPLMTREQLARFRTRARTDNRYYDGCPVMDPSTHQYDLSGQVVWIEGCASPPNLTNRVLTVPCDPPNDMAEACINAPDEPGLLIWHCGRADFAGGMTFRGIIYVVNNSDGTCPASLPARGDGTCTSQSSVDPLRDVMNTNGGFGVWGALAIDGSGCLKVGSNGLQVKFDPNAFDAVQSYGTVGLVQNTWRELPPNAI